MTAAPCTTTSGPRPPTAASSPTGIPLHGAEGHPLPFRCYSRQRLTIIAALHHALHTDAKLAEAFRVSLLEPPRDELAGVVERAVQRQELPDRPGAARFLPQLVWSASVARPFFEGLTADADYLAEFVDDVILPALRHS